MRLELSTNPRTSYRLALTAWQRALYQVLTAAPALKEAGPSDTQSAAS